MKSSYIAEFDTMRALAALGVMVSHFEPCRGLFVLAHLEDRLGALGVDLFFALSGFLITGILLDCRDLDQPKSLSLQRFYWRRFLRILPLYYLAVALFFVISPEIRHNWPWFASHTVNFGKAYNSDWSYLNHFWTLAVEEQFYFVWPFLMLFAPRRWLVSICIGSAVISFFIRSVLVLNGASNVAIGQFTFCCLEPLALGSVVAISSRTRRVPFFWTIITISGMAAVLLVVCASARTLYLFGRTANGIFFSLLIYLVASNNGHRFLLPLRLSPFVYLGRISYGLYVWHLPAMWLATTDPVHPPSWMPRGTDRISDFGALVLITIAASSISWFLFESPINNLKRYFPYRKTPWV